MSTPIELPLIPPNIASLTAPQLIGTLFNWTLFGVLSVQTYVYYLNFPDDKLWNKLLVYGTYIFEVVQTAMTGSVLYFWFASGYGDLIDLGQVQISPVETPIFCGIIAGVVQCFFAYRIFTLRRSYLWICVLIVLIAIAQTAGAIAVGWLSLKFEQFALFHESVTLTQTAYVWLLGDTLCDILIAGTMLWLYYSSRQEGLKNGTRILGRLVRLIVETNTLTAAIALTSFVCYVTLPNSSLFIATTLVMGKLYSNTLLVTFNNRIGLRKAHMNESSSYGSGGTGRTPIRRPNDFNSEVSTFRIASDRFGAKSGDSYEIRTLSENKERDLTSTPSVV